MEYTSLKRLLLPLLIVAYGTPAGDAATYKEVGGRVVIEAEHFDKRTADPDDGKNWLVVPDEDPGQSTFQNARADKYVQSLPEAGQGQTSDIREQLPTAEYKVQISTVGNYRLWLRWSGYDGGSDSIYGWMKEVTTPGWYRYATGGNPDDGDFASKVQGDGEGWDGLGGPEMTSAGGGEEPALFAIPSPGTYTIVIGQREDGSALDALIFQLESLPPPTNPGPPESPRADAAPQPLTVGLTPGPDAQNVPFTTAVSVIFTDGTTKLAQGSVTLELDGSKVTPSAKQEGSVTTVTYQPTEIFKPLSTHSALIAFTDDKGAKLSKSWTFTVQNYNVIPASWAVKADTSKPGFKVRVHQVDETPANQNTLSRTELQLAGKLTGADGTVLANVADLTGAGPDGFFVDVDVINYNQTEGGSAGAFTPDEKMPGIPGTSGGADNIAMEILTYLELPAGIIRMGVNSDDGFRTTAFPNINDSFSMNLGQFDGGRGAADTLFNFVVEAPGVYPFRTIWEEGGGDANIEWFLVTPDKKKILINDKTVAGSFKAYREAESLPYVKSITPAVGAIGVAVDAPVEFVISDEKSLVVMSSIKLSVNGTAVTPAVAKTGTDISVKYAPTTTKFPQGSRVELALAYSNTATPTATRTVNALFTTVRTTAPSLPASQQGSDGLIVVEAENYDMLTPQGGHTWNLGTTFAGYSSEGYMEGTPNGGINRSDYPDLLTIAPRLDYKVNFTKSGTHYIWIRGYAQGPDTGVNDSFNAGINGDNPDTARRVDGTPGFSTAWRWVGRINNGDRATIQVPAAGVHTVNIWMREDGSSFDKLIITSDANFSPTGLGPADPRVVTPPPPPTGEAPKFGGVRRDGNNLIIEWTGSGTLQSADSVTGPWVDVAGAASPRTVTPTPGAKFYRIKR